ncbi:hypothetical protein J6590_088428 [Homalodisca vitripennis]|nr:hypothetical protein J6590_088428 [Homalodisca vitripennis]
MSGSVDDPEPLAIVPWHVPRRGGRATCQHPLTPHWRIKIVGNRTGLTKPHGRTKHVGHRRNVLGNRQLVG